MECGDVFTSKAKLAYHVDVIHKNKFQCVCLENFASTPNLTAHIEKMTKNGEMWHEPMMKKVVREPEISASKAIVKRKAEEMDPLKRFFDSVADKINTPDPTKPLCLSQKYCTTTRLSHGFPGERPKYCSNHKDEVPGLVDLYKLCKYVGCSTHGHEVIKTSTGQLKFCPTHRMELIQQGLPNPDVNAKRAKNYNPKCSEEGCDKHASYDNRTHCPLHAVAEKSDDKRICEIEGCYTRTSVGYPGEAQRRCGEHKEEGMVPYGLCAEQGCRKRASYGRPDGKKMSCVTHKKEGYVLLGLTLCAMSCCSTNTDGLQAVFFHPEHQDETSEFFNKRICRFGRRVLIEDALMHNDITRLESLMTHFKMDRVLTLNAQSAFRFSCESMYHTQLKDCEDIVFDATVENGPKVFGALRPDIFYKWCIDGVNYGIHIEYDERESHEDDMGRLKCIAEQAGCLDRVYVIRVDGGHDTKNPVCSRVDRQNFSYFQVTAEGEEVARDVADAVVQRIGWIKRGEGPCGSRPAMTRFGSNVASVD